MKKVVGFFLSLVLILSIAVIPVSATNSIQDVQTTTSVEYLSDGSYIVTELTQTQSLARSSSTSGSKTATHYTANGKALWRVTVYGTFTYTPGVSAKATSASATVGIIDNEVTFVEKNAYTSGASAYGYGKVKYLIDYFEKTVKLTCDTSGNLS